jgi:hypothetical protein
MDLAYTLAYWQIVVSSPYSRIKFCTYYYYYYCWIDVFVLLCYLCVPSWLFCHQLKIKNLIIVVVIVINRLWEH